MSDVTVTITITAKLPHDVSPANFVDYVTTEVLAGRGGLHPLDPITSMADEDIKIKLTRISGVVRT